MAEYMLQELWVISLYTKNAFLLFLQIKETDKGWKCYLQGCRFIDCSIY